MTRDMEARTGVKFQFAIDRGGTFTDVWARCPSGRIKVMKLLSEDPANYSDAAQEAIRRIIQEETGTIIPVGKPLDASCIDWIRMATTVATNALLERKGQRMALAINSGLRDLLHIGNQSRPNLFDLAIATPSVLYEEVVEVEGRIVLQRQDCQLSRRGEIVTGTTGQKLEIWQPVNLEKLKKNLQDLFNKGIKSLAVVLMHSYMYDKHEREVAEIAKQLGFTYISLSSEVMPMIRMVPRGYTACADAYLSSIIKEYVSNFTSGFGNGMENVKVNFMQSDGGLTSIQKFTGARAIMSGPAGGVVGHAMTTYGRETNLPVIGFDMGGTSTDVSRYAGEYEHIFENKIGGVSIQVPQLDINTVAAGGGSRLLFRAGLFVVGPESAGAHPGPVCYMKGGPLTVTDANLCTGRLLPQYFPCIFGKTEDQPLDKEATLQAFYSLTDEVNDFAASQPGYKKPMSPQDVAIGFIKVANEAMCRPIRAITEARGHNTSRHVLACFGGAGGQHACSIARTLGMSTVFVHRYAGVLSAFGLALADEVEEAQEPCAAVYCQDNFKQIDDKIKALVAKCRAHLAAHGYESWQISTEAFLHMRYDRTDCALMCSAKGFPASTTSSEHGDFKKSFLDRYDKEFGFTIPARSIVVDDIRVRGVGKTHVDTRQNIPPKEGPPEVETVVKVYYEDGYQDTNIYLLSALRAGHQLLGPSIIIDETSTILVEPNCKALITGGGDIKITIGGGEINKVGTQLDTIQLSIFSHRFMSIAEQMGRVLQRSAISTNIKERLDFSCALFGPDGGLVANAPHIPVHLGAMQESVQYQMQELGDSLREGDVILTNHPCAGGSHLPDLTVITPVFYEGADRPVFYVAGRGHHADIGGITPGSMPPHSQSIFEEGALFKSFFLVRNGVFNEEAVTVALNAPGNSPGNSGTRNLNDNLSDLRAQVAANQKGIKLVCELIDEYGLDVVQAYMAHIQSNAETAVRQMLRDIAKQRKKQTDTTKLFAKDYLDDGSPIVLTVDIDEEEGSATFDFAGTGCEVHGNCNAPRAVTLSALIYCLRCMVGHDMPLNQGCLVPVKVNIPKGCLLNPSDTAAVVGGNVLTSQRVVDVVLKAFCVCAASQGCMNNVTFGDKNVGYYETVGGGAGAGPSWHGHSGSHSHMTNTRITDPEILESRYPVILNKFHLNPSSGGRGQYSGGNGVVRELLFRKPLVLSVLTERRVYRPYGLKGGLDGAPGLNLMIYADGRTVNLGGKRSVEVSPGDCLKLLTPGGGGFGKPNEIDDTDTDAKKKRTNVPTGLNLCSKGGLYTYTFAQESA